MDNSGARKSFPSARNLDGSDSEGQPRLSIGARRLNFSGHRGSYELGEDVASRVASNFLQTESLPQKQVAKGSVDNGYHDGKVENLSGALTPSTFEKQNGSTKPSSTRAASEEKTDIPQMKQIVPYFKLFKYADRVDRLLMFLGTGMAVLDGFVWPAIVFIQSRLVNSFGGSASQNAYEDVCRVSNMLFSTLVISARKENVCNPNASLNGDCLLYEFQSYLSSQFSSLP